MSYPLLFVLLVLASYRIWRLIGQDEITARLRDRLPKWLYDPLTCPWCLGSWCAFAVVGAVWAFRPLPLPALWFAAVACGVGLLSRLDEG